jgi:hypothetical protein
MINAHLRQHTFAYLHEPSGLMVEYEIITNYHMIKRDHALSNSLLQVKFMINVCGSKNHLSMLKLDIW